MQRAYVASIMIALSQGVAAIAATIEVSRDGTKPFATIQAAIDQAASGDVVLVEVGKYTENIDFKGKNITVASRFLLTGDLSITERTILDGDANGLPVVAFRSHEPLSAQLIGLTITNGLNPSGGGGIIIHSASATIRDCRIVKNRGPSGGGIDVYYAESTPNIESCVFEGNAVTGAGGAIYMFASTVLVQRCSFLSNTANDGASAIFWFGRGGVQIRHCLFQKNRGPAVLGLPGTEPGGQAQIVNCTLFGNSSTIASVRSKGSLFIVNSILQDSIARQINSEGVVFVDYSIVRGGSNSLANTFAGGTKFGANNGTNLVVFRASGDSAGLPQIDSPSIGAGISKIAFPGAEIIVGPQDIYGNSVPNPPGSAPDIGAAESRFAAPVVLASLPNQKPSLGYKVHVRSEVGFQFLIEASIDLTAWMPLATLTNQTGEVEYIDDQARDLPQRFYRLRTLD